MSVELKSLQYQDCKPIGTYTNDLFTLYSYQLWKVIFFSETDVLFKWSIQNQDDVGDTLFFLIFRDQYIGFCFVFVFN